MPKRMYAGIALLAMITLMMGLLRLIIHIPPIWFLGVPGLLADPLYIIDMFLLHPLTIIAISLRKNWAIPFARNIVVGTVVLLLAVAISQILAADSGFEREWAVDMTHITLIQPLIIYSVVGLTVISLLRRDAK